MTFPVVNILIFCAKVANILSKLSVRALVGVTWLINANKEIVIGMNRLISF